MSKQKSTILMFGVPGAGKGLFSKKISELLNRDHVITSTLLKQIASDPTHPHSEYVRKTMAEGGLVKEEISIEATMGHLLSSKKNSVLDGYPRSIGRWNALVKDVRIDLVFHLTIPTEEMIRRQQSRWVCKICREQYDDRTPEGKAIIKTKKCPKVLKDQNEKPMVCDGELYQRDDATTEAILHRKEVFETETLPLLELVREMERKENRKILYEVDNNKPIIVVLKKILEILIEAGLS
ncbi:MAG: nucleoside monophosphate kinase [Firmicutes bacterium]|nr:nucleoside monophosphate kinase [Bacillota bacterium]